VGLFGEIRREFVARPDAAKGQIVFKWPDHNVRKLTQLTVQADETALFMRDGKLAGTLPPGRHTLESSEIPFLGALLDAATGGNFFLSEIYFVSTREVPDLPFGGVVDDVIDAETQLAVGLRVFGEYSLRVLDAQALILGLVGTRDMTTNAQITDWMREQLLKVLRTGVVSHIVDRAWPILGIASHTEEIERETLERVRAQIAGYGLEVARLGNFTISLSETDAATLKNFRRDASYTKLAGGFTQYGAGEALRGIGEGAAQGGGNVGGAVLGMGLGLGGLVGGILGTPVANAPQANPSPAAASPQSPSSACGACGAQHAPDARFCPQCGASTVTAQTCAQCGAVGAPGMKFCAACGTKFAGA